VGIFCFIALQLSAVGVIFLCSTMMNIEEQKGFLNEVASYKTMGKNAQVPEGAIVVKSKKGFIKAVYNMAIVRTPKASFYYAGDYNDIFDSDINGLLSAVCSIDDKSTSDDGEYLENSISTINVSTSYNYIGSKILDSTITVNISYLETAAQLEAVNIKVEEILSELNLEGKSRYKKIKLIHDYIVNNTQYAYGANAHTAYGALQGKAVCQGYSQLAYKLLTEAGVPCHYIAGQAFNGQRTEDHAWNMVKLSGEWYYLDVTWDDPTGVGEDILRYDYFLKGTRNFHQDHTAFSDYKRLTSKVSKKDYKK